MAKKDRGVNPMQEQVILALLTHGNNKTKAAEAAGVHRNTLYRFLRDKNFLSEYRRVRRDCLAKAFADLETSARRAIKAVRRETGSKPAILCMFLRILAKGRKRLALVPRPDSPPAKCSGRTARAGHPARPRRSC
jgi:AcrR family transcriptional regulator